LQYVKNAERKIIPSLMVVKIAKNTVEMIL
jgi:hypothetical protein